jgi:hypothetical protein
MRTAKRILLACTAMAAVTTSAHASDLPIAYPTKAPPAGAACASYEDFRDTDCSLTWHGITLYGAYDVGAGWVSHGLPENGYNYEGESLVNRNRNHPQYLVAPNNLSQTGLGIKGTQEIAYGLSGVFNASTGINPQSGQLGEPGVGAVLKATPHPVPDSYSPPTISNGETQLTAGSCRVLHFGQVSTWVLVSLLPSAERQSETDICHALMQERPGLQYPKVSTPATWHLLSIVNVPAGTGETVTPLPRMQVPEVTVPLAATWSGQEKPLFWPVP